MSKGQALAATATAGAAVLLVVAVVAFNSSKDTPIVVAGGSIYGDTDFSDSDGWKHSTQTDPYAASVHGPGSHNPNGIGSITLSGFDQNPASPITATNSWAISFSNVDQNNVEKSRALRLCSDANCSASQYLMNGTQNTQRCSGTFNSMGPVFLGVRSDSRLQENRPFYNKNKVNELRFHDGTSNCDSSNDTPESSCDVIYKITVETCSPPPTPQPSSTDYRCQNNKKCKVQIGHGLFN